ncbi:hypothetical protein KFK09_003139 [Dendrobium nobile]|uniref:Uncharacterized protein n=1 Tax=Dendrobium nobile TaxID=94219 RepID=A0A8T3C6U5_DENNO|nr:hypothetical protein KFK09_003139 [Dendrobium nobile]
MYHTHLKINPMTRKLIPTFFSFSYSLANEASLIQFHPLLSRYVANLYKNDHFFCISHSPSKHF